MAINPAKNTTNHTAFQRLALIGRTVLVCIIAGIVLVMLVFMIPYVNRLAARIVSTKASTITESTVRLASLTIDLLHGLRVHTIRIDDPANARPSVFIEDAAVSIDIGALLQGRIALGALAITGLRGTLVKTPDNIYAGPVDIGRLVTLTKRSAKKSSIPSKPFVHTITAQRCSVSYVDNETGISTGEQIRSLQMEFVRADSFAFKLQGGIGYFAGPTWKGGVHATAVIGAIGPHSLSFTTATVTGDSAQVSVQGTIPFNDQTPWNFSAVVKTFIARFPHSGKTLGPLIATGTINAIATMTGSIRSPVLAVTATGYNLQTGKTAIDSVNITMHYAHNRLHGTTQIQSSTVKADASLYATITNLHHLPDTMVLDVHEQRGLTANLALIKNNWKVSADFNKKLLLTGKGLYTDSGPISGTVQVSSASIASIASLAAIDSVDGSLTATIGIQGSLADPAIDAKLHMATIRFGRYRADTIFAAGTYANRNLKWQSLKIRQDSIAIQSTGALTWTKRTVSVYTENGFTRGKHNAGSFIMQYTQSVNRSTDATMSLSKFDPLTLAPWFPAVKHAAGTVNASATMQGPGSNPAITAQFSFDQPVLNSPPVIAAGTIMLRDSVLSSSITISQKSFSRPLTVTASIPLYLPKVHTGLAAIKNGARITVRGDSVSLGGIVNALVPSIASTGALTIAGALEKTAGTWAVVCTTHLGISRFFMEREQFKVGRTDIKGTIGGLLTRPVAAFAIRGDSLQYRGALFNRFYGKGSIAQALLTIDTIHITADSGAINLHATLPFSTARTGGNFFKNSTLLASCVSMPLVIVQPLLPDQIEITSGTISGQVTVLVKADGRPAMTGRVSLDKGGFIMFGCDRLLGPVTAGIDLKNDSLMVRTLRSPWGDGLITGEGLAVLGPGGLTAAHGKIVLDNVRVKNCYESLDLGIAHAAIDLAADTRVVLRADISLAPTRLTQDFSIVDLGERLGSNAIKTLRPLNPAFDRFDLQCSVNLNDNLTFDSNLGTMVFGGMATISGRPDRPAITGRLAIQSGFVYYLDRKFVIQQGTIRQYEPLHIDPLLNISAVSAVSWYLPQGGQKEYDITLTIKDNLSNPAIGLSSTPALSQPQIISLLTLGTMDANAASDLSGRTGSLLSRQLTGLGNRTLARFLQVDNVDIYGNIFDPTLRDATVSITKQVSPRVAVTYKTALTSLGRQMLLVSLRLFPFLYLEAQSDQQAQGGIDLKFRYSR